MWTLRTIAALSVFAVLFFLVVAIAHRNDKQNANGYATRARHRKFERDQERGWDYDPTDEDMF